MTAPFIAFEGGEGSGKSTQARLLGNVLARHGIDHVVTREPGGTAGAEAIRNLLLHPPAGGWHAQAEALLFAAARSDHVARLIRPALARGEWVICDRFVDSSRAYQGGAGNLGDDAIIELHQFGSDGLRPDLTVLIEISEDLARQRLRLRDTDGSDAIGGRPPAYHAAVAGSFRRLAEMAPKDFAIIDGSGGPEVISAKIVALVSQRFGLGSRL